MKLVIFGAGGFIGSNLVDHLIADRTHTVVGMDIADDKLEGIEGPNFTFVKGDVRKSDRLVEELVRDSDVVVDLVAYANPSIYVDTPLDVFELNFLQNLKIVDLCVAHGKRLFQYSTSEVYGKPAGDAYVEDASDLILGPISKQRWIYACSKQLLERIIHAHGLRGDLVHTIVRPFNFVGPRFDYLVPAGATGGPRVFAHFMSALLTGGPMYLVDGGEQHRAFTHIQDCNEAFTILLESPEAKNEIFNIGNPETDISIFDLAALMKDIYRELTGKEADNELRVISGEEFYGSGYEDMDRVAPDISKLSALGWEPKRDLRTTFRDAIAFHLDPKVRASISG